LQKDAEMELFQLPKGGSILDSLLDRDASLSMPISKKLLAGAGVAPELMKHLQAVEFLLNNRGEKIWAVLPYRVEVK
jgi:hypothetical protein